MFTTQTYEQYVFLTKMLCTSFAYVMEMFNVFHNDINVAHNVIHIVGNF